MCGRNVIRVISDLHLASHWHTEENVKALDVCLDECSQPNTFVSCLVIAGDILEQWLIPYDEDIPDVEGTLNAPGVIRVFDKLKAIISNGVRVFYMRGNHDDELDTPSLRHIFGDNDITIVEGEELILNGCRFVHGHWYDLMSQPYLGAKYQRPLSYYMARVVAFKGAAGDRASPSLLTFSYLVGNHFFNICMMAFYMPGLFPLCMRMGWCVAFQDKWDNIKNEKFKLRNGNVLTVAEAVTEYNNLLKHARSRYGNTTCAAMFRMSLSGSIGHWMRRSPYLVEVAGHTHMAKLRTYMRYRSTLSDGSKSNHFLDTKVLYANTGSFTNGESTFVDIMMADSTRPIGWTNQLPPYLFGLQHPRSARSYYDTYRGGPPHGLTPHTWDRQGSVAAEWGQEAGEGGVTIPYEVRLYEWRDGAFSIRKAKRVPYRFDPSSIGKQGGKGDDVNAYKVPADKAFVIEGNDQRVAVSVTGSGIPDPKSWVTGEDEGLSDEDNKL